MTDHALILGIESSCDETAAAVVEQCAHNAPGSLVLGRIRSNVVASQADVHAEYGGVVPEIASRAHVETILPVIERAVRDAGVTLADLDAIAVGHRPGLIGSLLVGVSAAKALAWSLGVPVVGVDHVHAHLMAGLLDAEPVACSPASPALGLVVSGGHTALYRIDDVLRVQRLGATIDDALGEAYDKAGTILGLDYPAGPKVDRLAQQPEADDRAHDFPISRLGPRSLDFSFSGLKTRVLYAVRGSPARERTRVTPLPPMAMTEANIRDVSASFQRVACAAIVLKLERALEQLAERGTPARTLLTGGGVIANSRLRRSLMELAERRGLDLRLPAMALCVDNAAMIAGLGAARFIRGEHDDLTLSPMPTTAC